MDTKQALPSVYGYVDFRRYLADYWRARRSIEPSFTHAHVCRCLGQRGSKSYFANVLAGTKIVTSEFVNRFIELLDLDEFQSRYFEMLVAYGQSYNPREKSRHLAQLLELGATSNTELTSSQFEYYREWFHPVVRAALDLVDFTGDYSSLAAVPPIG